MIKSTGATRRVDELGRIVLPIETRRLLGIEEKDSLEIFADEECGQIILKRADKACAKCRSTESLKEVKSGLYLCENCIESLK